MMRVAGRLRVPGDKSISHRAIIFAALAEGRSRVRGILDSADIRSTAGVFRAMGVAVPPLAPDMEIAGAGLRGLRPASQDLDCGNSGTTARLCAGVLAASPLTSRLVGDASLSRRPMRRIARPLEAMGARFTFERGDGLPMTISGGALRELDWESDTASAQVKSAVLLAGLVAGVRVSVTEPARSRTHTERMLGALGARVRTDGLRVTLEPAEAIRPVDMLVPSDPSSAAFLAGLAAAADDGEIVLESVCADETRTGFYRALARMGADIALQDARTEGGEEVAEVRVRPGTLRGTEVGADEIPSMIDELPLLACLAARAQGETVITGAEELRVKESDRIASVVAGLRAIGADAEELPDGMRIVGGRAPLRGRIVTHGDHRLAMAFGVLAALPGSDVDIDDPGCVDVSYPGFWSDLRRVIRT